MEGQFLLRSKTEDYSFTNRRVGDSKFRGGRDLFSGAAYFRWVGGGITSGLDTFKNLFHGGAISFAFKN